jgi:glycosyltransferase involved in cell wall biosynthesis
MKVLHLSHFDRKGGACIAAYRQHQALRAAGVDSSMWVRHKVTNDPHVFEYRPQSDVSARVRRIARRQWLGLQKKRAQPTGEIFDDRSEYGGGELLELPPHDVINVQFSQGFVDLPALLAKIPATTPIVFTLHEMSMFTGGCSYAYDCRGFENQCGNCPQLGAGQANDFSRRSWLRKHEAYTQRNSSNLHFAADSHWIAKEASKSSLLGAHAVSTMHYGVDITIFRPLDATPCKEMLGIPLDRPVVAFAAVSVADKRKGASYLIEAIQQMKEKPFLLTWGASFPPELEQLPHLHLGSVDSEHLLATVYNAADVFVIPSMEEAFGQTALESLACARPVVGSNVGGIPDMVLDGETGLLVERGDAIGLAAALDIMLQDQDKREQMGVNARELVLSKFSFEKNASAYLDLYQAMKDSSAKQQPHNR